MTDSSIRHHMDRTHGIFLPQTRGVDVGGGGGGYICGVISMGTEVGGVTGRLMHGKDEQLRETQTTLHVLALEGECVKYTWGTGTAI